MPVQLQFQRLYLNMNLVEVDFESDNLTEASFDGCLNLTRVKIKAPLRRFSTDAPLKSLFLESTVSYVHLYWLTNHYIHPASEDIGHLLTN